jgi:hypothetical protein
MPFVPPSSLTGTGPFTVTVTNFPATQAVTVDALPLPAGAATEETLVSVLGAENDTALTAILQREAMETQ